LTIDLDVMTLLHEKRCVALEVRMNRLVAATKLLQWFASSISGADPASGDSAGFN